MSLLSEVDAFTQTAVGPEKLYELIAKCVELGGAEGLLALRRMAEDDYGGITYKYELQAPPTSSLVLFGEAGLRELADMAISNPTGRRAVLAMELLAHIAAGPILSPMGLVQHSSLKQDIQDYLIAHPSMREASFATLVDIVVSFESDDLALSKLGLALMTFAMTDVPAARFLSAAMSARWASTSRQVLDEFDALIIARPSHEPSFQAFLTAHPQLLDPFAIEVWSRPDLNGARIPDFVVRRADNTYLVVEIECPSKKLVTKSGKMSAETNHAIGQATDYNRFLQDRHQQVRTVFPKWNVPDLLVVCGLENGLPDPQRDVLQNHNQNSKVRVVGFDWLSRRARAVSSNLLEGKIEVRVKSRMY